MSIAKIIMDRESSITTLPSIAAGEVTVRIVPPTPNCAYPNNLITVTSKGLAVGEVTLRPTITPREEGILTDDTFRIEVPAGTTVYYKMIVDKDKNQITSADYPTNSEESGSIQYTPNSDIQLPAANVEKVTVLAIAYSPEAQNKAPSAVDMVTFTKDNRNRPSRPTLKIGANPYDNAMTYRNGQEIHFEHSDLSGSNAIYFTTNDSTPSNLNGERYDKNNPKTRDFGTNSALRIRAIFYDNERGLESEVAEFIITQKGSIGTAVASIKNNAAVKPGQSLYLHLGDRVAAKIEASYGVSSKYGSAYDSENYPYKRSTSSDSSDEHLVGSSYL